jgi:putative addiction module component (TIGR02574 family)
MTVAMEKLKTELAELTPAERAELAHFLIDSIDDSWDEGSEAAWDDELARRAEEICSAKVQGKPVEQLFAELHEKRS